MNSNNYFIYDGCYKQPATSIVSDISFEINLRNNYYKTTVSNVKECETQSLKNNSEFFLINDIKTTLNKTNTNCYIPKMDNTNPSLFGNNSIIARSKQLFDNLFYNNSSSVPYIKQDTTIDTMDICNSLMFNENKTLANQKCFKYTLDKQVYTPEKFFAYYKKPILNAKNISLMNSIDSPDYYKSKLEGLKTYEALLKIDAINFTNSGQLPISFKNFICDPTVSNERLLDAQIYILNQNYENYNESLDSIINDLSSISYLNSFDDDTLKALNLNIVSKSRELNSLLGSGGANNGRLDDTTLLTQFKIVENSILLLVIISAIFYFTKNKKSI